MTAGIRRGRTNRQLFGVPRSHVKWIVFYNGASLQPRPKPLHSKSQVCILRMLKWVAISSARGSSQPEVQPASLESPVLASMFFTTWEAPFPSIYFLQTIWQINITQKQKHFFTPIEIFSLFKTVQIKWVFPVESVLLMCFKKRSLLKKEKPSLIWLNKKI